MCGTVFAMRVLTMEAVLSHNKELEITPKLMPRSKLHHLVCHIGVERETPVKVRSALTVEELEAINKRDARVIAKPS